VRKREATAYNRVREQQREKETLALFVGRGRLASGESKAQAGACESVRIKIWESKLEIEMLESEQAPTGCNQKSVLPTLYQK